jgi:Ran GTPase-activating protein (RanGAP) involved in mRNA processing and transport
MANQIQIIYPIIADLMYGVNNILVRQDAINNNVLCGNNITGEASKKLDNVIKGLVALLDPTV